MATFEDSEKVRINKQYQEIVRKIPFSSPFDLRRAVEVAARNLRDFRLDLYKQKTKIQQKHDKEQENLKKQTDERHTQLISILNKTKRAVAPYDK